MLLCDAAALPERGRAWLWDVVHCGTPVRAFVVRIEGRLHAYLNRCPHAFVELDWQPGEFLDAERRWIVCSRHGATFAPQDGRCIGGPCRRGGLTALRVEEHGEGVYWYPSRDIRPVATPRSPPPESPP